MATVTLFRPGRAERARFGRRDRLSGLSAAPSRAAIFFPVLNRQYAEQIARDWNTKDERSGYSGYVLEFEVDTEYLRRFQVRKVGGTQHIEYWVPADELGEFNGHIKGPIRVIAQFSR